MRVVLSDNTDISHRSELSSLFSCDNAVDNRGGAAPLPQQTGRPRHRFAGDLKSQLAPLNVLIYRVLGVNCPNTGTSLSARLRLTDTAGDVFSFPGPRYL